MICQVLIRCKYTRTTLRLAHPPAKQLVDEPQFHCPVALRADQVFYVEPVILARNYATLDERLVFRRAFTGLST